MVMSADGKVDKDDENIVNIKIENLNLARSSSSSSRRSMSEMSAKTDCLAVKKSRSMMSEIIESSKSEQPSKRSKNDMRKDTLLLPEKTSRSS